MVKGSRELVIGMIRDAQFGPCVMFGLGGIFTEVLKDVSFRIAPLERRDALEMAREIKGAPVLGPFRGMPPVDMDLLVSLLINAGKLGLELETVKEVDVNPLIIAGNRPVAVDALVVLEDKGKA
jgi:acetyl-CoA synthetase (ADP-forming)